MASILTKWAGWAIRMAYLFVFLTSSSSYAQDIQKGSSSVIELETLVAEQKPILSVLSGVSPTYNNLYIPSRCKKEEKVIARDYLKKLFESAGLTAEEQPYRMPNLNPLIDLLYAPFEGVNVYAIIPATTSSNDYVLLGAHYDTELGCPGAIDNATGMVLAFSVAKRLARLKERKKNVLLVLFDQEEEDLTGSQAFAKLVARKKFDLHSVHTVDMMGWDEDGDRAIELELPTKELEAIYRTQAKQMDIPIHVTQAYSTDHHSFRVLGHAAIGITEEYVNQDSTPFKDTPQDTFDTLNFRYLASTTALIYTVFEDIITH